MVDPTFANELRSSGVSFSANYIGSVPIETSVNAMVSELRTQVVTECIQQISWKVGIIPHHEINSVVERMIGEVKEENFKVELNISSKMIKIIKDNQLIQRHPLKFFSFGTQGAKNSETESMFGYIAKNKQETDRRCHVINTQEVARLIDVLTAAIQVATTDENSKAGTAVSPAPPPTTTSPSNDEFARPTLPVRVRNSVDRNGSKFSADNININQQIWYHGKLSREEAQQLLQNPGDYLVRQSDHSPGQLILSGLTMDNEYRHLTLLDDHGLVRTRDHNFNTTPELIDYHVKHNIPVRSVNRETSVYLIRPIPK